MRGVKIVQKQWFGINALNKSEAEPERWLLAFRFPIYDGDHWSVAHCGVSSGATSMDSIISKLP
jgi:hypothetical protein